MIEQRQRVGAWYPKRAASGRQFLYLSCLAWTLGIFTLWGLDYLVPVFFVLAYTVLLCAIFQGAWSSRDWLNPLVLMLIIGFLRFSITGFMTWMGIDSHLRIFDLMGIEAEDWMRGHVLALTGLLGVVTGWHLNLRMPASLLGKVEDWTRGNSPALPLAATVCMIAGLVALYLFVSSNISFHDALFSGEMRGTEIQEGTGKYYRLSFLLVAGSVVFSVYLANCGWVWWLAMAPSVVASAAVAILGGRTLTSIPIAAAWVALWTCKANPKTSMKIAMLAGLAVAPVYFLLGQVYRGGSGIEGVTAEAFSFESVVRYLEYSVWLDWGHLHSMAAAVMIGPAVLGGQTFTVLLWPLSRMLGLPARSAGVFMVDTLLPDYHPVSRGKWGFHATLIGDAYLNFGSLGVVVVTIIFGALLRVIYTQVRQRLSNAAIYGLATVCSLQVFYISIENMSDVFLILGFAVVVVQLARFFEIPSVAARRSHGGVRLRDLRSRRVDHPSLEHHP